MVHSHEPHLPVVVRGNEEGKCRRPRQLLHDRHLALTAALTAAQEENDGGTQLFNGPRCRVARINKGWDGVGTGGNAADDKITTVDSCTGYTVGPST